MIELSREQAAKLLVGRSVEVSVSEPWDFDSTDGQNALRGRIASVSGGLTSNPSDEEIVLEVSPFKAEGGSIVDRVTARRRHVDDVGIIERLIVGRDAVVNMSYREQIPEAKRDPKSSQFLIGSFHLTD